MNPKEDIDSKAKELLSAGSLVGIGIGTTVSNLLNFSFTGFIIGSIILSIGAYNMKQKWYLTKP